MDETGHVDHQQKSLEEGTSRWSVGEVYPSTKSLHFPSRSISTGLGLQRCGSSRTLTLPALSSRYSPQKDQRKQSKRRKRAKSKKANYIFFLTVGLWVRPEDKWKRDSFSCMRTWSLGLVPVHETINMWIWLEICRNFCFVGEKAIWQQSGRAVPPSLFWAQIISINLSWPSVFHVLNIFSPPLVFQC